MSEQPAEYYVSKAPKPLRGMDYLRKRVQNWCRDLSVEGRCYGVGLAILAIAAGGSVFKKPLAVALAQVGALVFAFGLLPLVERLYKWAWKCLLGKLIIAALIALATNMGYGFGRQMVSELVGTSPEPFSATVNVGTILLSPVLFLMALAIGGIFIFGAALYVGMLASMAFLSSQTPGRGKHACLWLCRLIALAIAVFGSWHLLNRSDGYTAWVSRRTASYLYTFDMYRDAQQAKGKDEKVAFLPDGRLLIGTPRQGGGYVFEARRLPDGSETRK